MSQKLIKDEKFTEYMQEAKIALADILYLPQEFESDDAEAKSGFENACEFINTKVTEFFKGKELPLTKKVFDQLANWIEKQRVRL